MVMREYGIHIFQGKDYLGTLNLTQPTNHLAFFRNSLFKSMLNDIAFCMFRYLHFECVNYVRILLMSFRFRRFPTFFQYYA